MATAEHNIAKYHQRMSEAREYLGGVCVVCGTTEDLNCDHIDPKTKEFAISEGWGKPAKIFWAEVNKCQLLCVPHHWEKSRIDGSIDKRRGSIPSMAQTRTFS